MCKALRRRLYRRWNTLAGVVLCTSAALGLGACVAQMATGPLQPGFATLDASAGRVGAREALLWLGGRPGQTVEVTWQGGATSGKTRVLLDQLGSSHLVLPDLSPRTRYAVNIDAGREHVELNFRSAPATNDAGPVHFLFGGDLAGQNACRDAARGFPVFEAMTARRADLFIGLGDMIYADGQCKQTGPFGNRQVVRTDAPLSNVESFMTHWRYNYADPAFQRLRHSLAYEPVWDDHEIVNDFGPATARTAQAPDVDLLAPGRRAFVASNPVVSPGDAPNRLYRRFRYGAHAEFFLLDTRQYRDSNELDDTGVLPKSLLGAQQRQWLIDAVTNSKATWKFVVSSVPITIPTGWPVEKGRDGWASGDGDDGFERELYAVFGALSAAGVNKLVWLSADVHFATGFELRPLPQQPNFNVRELVVGPLSAGIFPTDAMDPTFSPTRLYYHAPQDTLTSLDDALNFYNFGDIQISAAGELVFSLVNGHGKVVQQLTFVD